MNHLSHKQAIQWINRRLDGLLTKRQLSLLDEHLRSCDSCSAYAAEMDRLPARLQNEFHARWDEKPGPSQKVMQHVTTKARNIPMKNRISAGVKLFAGAGTLILLAFVINFFVSGLRDTFTTATGTEIVNVLPRAEDRLLAFASKQSGNVDIYTMHADGSKLTNLTNDPAQDANPFWSPDGKQIAFESDRSGLSQIYLMDADGSNVVQLTADEVAHYLPMNVDGLTYPWSPDGSKILFLQSNPDQETWTLIAQNIRGGDRTSLVTGQLYYNGISWSPDGDYIGYLLDSSPNSPPLTPAIYITDANGSETRDLEALLPQNEGMDSRYRWSAEAGSLIFTTRRLDPPRGTAETVTYEYDLGSNTLLQDDSKKMADWEESTGLITAFRSFERSGLISIRQFPDGTGSTFDVDSQCLEQNIRSSPRGNFAIGAYCPDHQFRLYWANSDRSTIIRQIPDFPIPYEQDTLLDLVWSPDDRYLAFNVTSLDETNLYVLDMEKALADPSIRPVQMSISSEFSWLPSWQPVVDTKVAEEEPTPVATPRASDRLLAFASIQNGNSDIYTMHADGSGLTNLTNDPAFDGSPFWSPDGKQIAFVSDRSGSAQIYLMDADGSNVIQLTNGEGNSGFDTNNSSSWSPDGTKLIFANKIPGEQGWKLYILDIHEKTSTALTNEPGAYLRPYWSPDGEHIAFIYYESEARPLARHLFVVDKNGNHLTELTESLRIDETGTSLDFNYSWSRDGMSVFFTATVSQGTTSTVYKAGLDGSLTVITSVESSFVVDWWEGTTLQEEWNARTLTWLRSDGSQATLDLCQSNDQALGRTYKRSDNGNLVFGANCSATGWILYWANADGTMTSQLLNSGIPARNESLFIFNISWSPDDHFIAFVSVDTNSPNVTETLYVLNVAEARKDPSLQPLKMESGSGPAWQPMISPTVVEEKPTPEPKQTSSNSGRIAFTAVLDGNLDIYTMRPDGSALTNLTNNPAQDVNPFWSPDGKRIAFESNREGLEHIYLMNADGSEVTRLTDGEARYEIGATYGMNSTPWSPDGTKLIVSLWPPGETTRTLYVMDVDGGNKTPLVSQPSNYFSFPSWSPDGQRITFIADDPTNPAATHLHIVNADGSQPVDVGQFLPENESLWAHNSYSWSQDGQSIFFIAYRYSAAGQNEWFVYEFSLPGNQLIEHARSSEPIGDWWQGTSFLTGAADGRSAAITWLHRDGTSTALKPFEKCELANQYSYTYQRSSHGNLVIAAHCPNEGWWLYRADDDGTAIQQLLDTPIVAEDFRFPDIAWSPDDRFITFKVKSGILTDLYILDVEATLQDPSTQPLKATTMGEEMFYNPSWQPVQTAKPAEQSFSLNIDPQSCKPFSDPNFDLQPPSALYGYEPIQGMSLVDGDFSYDFWLYCDPALKPDEEKNLNTVAGLGLFSSWDYQGVHVKGDVEYRYEFEPNLVLGGGSWNGPLERTSITGARFGIDLPAAEIQTHIRQGLPFHFRMVIDSPLGKKEALFSFKLEPAENGLKVVDLQSEPPATSREGLIAFAAAIENGNLDVYTMRPDGSKLTNLTQDPAQDVDPFWSPDGKYIAFESDRQGFTHLFLMDADGSHVRQLTNGEVQHQFPNANPWSPDGNRLLFTEWTSEDEIWMLSVIGVDGQNKIPLAQVPNVYINPSWSPDGQQVAFLADDPQNLGGDRIYVVDTDGHNRRDLTESLQANEQLSTSIYDWSADGRSIFFVSFLQKTDPTWTVYEARLDDSSLIELFTTNAPVLDWWKGVSVTGNFNDASTFTWTRSNETINTLHPYENCQSFDAARSGSYIKRSSNGTWLISTYCPNGDAWFYWIRSNGTITRQLLDFPIPSEQDTFLDLVWSPDDKFVAFNMFSNNLTEMYILDIAASLNDPSTQPLKTTIGGGNLFYNPSWQPTP